MLSNTLLNCMKCCFYYRSDAGQFRARRHPLGSAESEDGGNLIDDDMQALLPSSRGMSKDDLSQVSHEFDHFLVLFKCSVKFFLLPT